MSPPRRSFAALLRPRLRRVDLLVALLLGALGFAAAVQVRSQQAEGVLAAARTEDLVVVLDDLAGRSDRLRDEVAELTEARDRLAAGDGEQAALEQAQRRTQLLGVLAGTLPAVGPGVVLTVADPDAAVRAATLLDALEELRDAGAEAVQLEGSGGSGRRPPAGGPAVVRVVAGTALVDTDERGVRVDGVQLLPPYRYVVLGDPGTLASALRIPGGVVDTVARAGGTATVEEAQRLRVGALRPLARPRYARPAPGS